MSNGVSHFMYCKPMDRDVGVGGGGGGGMEGGSGVGRGVTLSHCKILDILN